MIFGHIALSQIKRTGQHGRGMALGGTILGYLWFALLLVIVVIAVSTPPTYGY